MEEGWKEKDGGERGPIRMMRGREDEGSDREVGKTKLGKEEKGRER